MSTPVHIFSPLPLEGYELCHPVDPADFETIHGLIDGTARKATWKSLAVHLIQVDAGKQLLEADAPWLGAHALIFRPAAIARLSPMLQEHGELLPLACPNAEVQLYNPTRIVDALDEANSSVLRFRNGRIMDIKRYAFKEHLLRGVHIFKIPNLRVSPTYVSQAFVDLWAASGLRGLRFRTVWPD